MVAPTGSRLGIALALLAVYVIWGSTYLGIKVALEGFPPFLMAGVRFFIAGGGLFLFLLLRGAPLPNRRQWGGAALVGCLLLVGGNGSVTFAEQWVESGLAAVWIATTPIWVALFSGFLGRWPNRLEWLGLALGVVGVGLLNLEGNFAANPIGVLALTIATASWAFGSVWSRKLQLPAGMMSSAAEMLVGGVVLLLLSFSTGERLVAMPGARPLLALAYLIIFGSIVAFSAYLYLLKKVRPALATSYAYINPVVAVGLGVGLVGETISSVGLVAMLIILAAVGLVALARDRTSDE